jgi:hypothetical protein
MEHLLEIWTFGTALDLQKTTIYIVIEHFFPRRGRLLQKLPGARVIVG